MSQNLMISNLSYEEIVLLQTILLDISLGDHYDKYDQEIFDELYEKVMNA